MDYNTYNLSPYQIDNLITLAKFLAGDTIPPPRFDIGSWMTLYNTRGERQVQCAHQVKPEMYNECGTTACAVGHGPLAGIPPLRYEMWVDYSDRVFGVSAYGSSWMPFNFMFGPDWKYLPKENTAHATAKRIIYFLKYGLPTNYHGEMQDWREYAPWDNIDVLKESEYLAAV